MMAEIQNPPALPPLAATGREKKKKQPKQKSEHVTLPVLVEFTFTASAILLVILFLVIISVSLFNGANLLNTVIRTAVSMLVMGGLLTIISRQIFSDVYNQSLQQQKEAELKQLAELNQKVEGNSPSEVL
jgi:uncharacterized membrane protein (DUF485 family)